MRRRPFVWCALWFVAGTLPSTRPDGWWIALTALAVLALLAAVPVRLLRWPAVAAAAFAAGGLLAQHAAVRLAIPDALEPRVPRSPHEAVLVRGVVEPTVRRLSPDHPVQAGVRVEAVRIGGAWKPVVARTWWSWYEPGPAPEPGTRLEIRGRLRAATGYRNPGLFDYGRYLREQGYCTRLNARGPDAVRMLGPGTLPPYQHALATIRRHMRRTLAQVPASADARAFLLAVLCGDRGWLSADFRDVASETGTYHLLAISGLHVGIVAGTVLAVLQLLQLRGPTITVLAVLALVGYAVATGAAVPVVRATLMFGVALVVLRRRRAPDGPSVLALVALVVAAVDPLAFRAAGAQLSFTAVAALVLVYPPAGRWLTAAIDARLPRRWRSPAFWLGHALLVSLVVEAALAPLLVWHFHRVPLVSIVANTVATPLLSVVLLTGALGVALLSVHPALGAGPAWLAAGASEALVRWIDFVGSAAAPLHAPVAFPGAGRLALYAGLLGLAWLALRRRPVWRFGTMGAWLVLLNLGPAAPTPGRLELTALEVGDGDATVLRFPNGEVMLVDGGRRTRTFDAGAYIVLPYLLRAGVRRVDYLVATHAHNDHLGGLITIVESLPVGQVWVNGLTYDSWTARRFEASCRAAGVVVQRARRGMRVDLGDATVRVLHPAAGYYAGPGDRDNNNSVALRVDYGGVAILLPADNSESFAAAVAAGAPWPARVLVKAPHHGLPSPGTVASVAGLRPLLTWASLSTTSAYGKPWRIFRNARQPYRLDRQGALRVAVEADGTVRAVPMRGVPRVFRASPGSPPAGTVLRAENRNATPPLAPGA